MPIGIDSRPPLSVFRRIIAAGWLQSLRNRYNRYSWQNQSFPSQFHAAAAFRQPVIAVHPPVTHAGRPSERAGRQWIAPAAHVLSCRRLVAQVPNSGPRKRPIGATLFPIVTTGPARAVLCRIRASQVAHWHRRCFPLPSRKKTIGITETICTRLSSWRGFANWIREFVTRLVRLRTPSEPTTCGAQARRCEQIT